MWLLDGYVRMLLETSNMKLIAQILELDSILYSLEDASSYQGVPAFINFDVPGDLTVVDTDLKESISSPTDNDLPSSVNSLNNNLKILTNLIVSNKNALTRIHEAIVSTASTYLD